MKAATSKKPAAKRPAAKPKRYARADLGAPVDAFFAKQPAKLRPITDELRKMIAAAVPEAEATTKWGMPFFSIDGAMMCAIGAHKAHVNLILWGAPAAFTDPEGRLSGGGKIGRHLKLTSVDELPRAAVRAWLRTAAAQARKKK